MVKKKKTKNYYNKKSASSLAPAEVVTETTRKANSSDLVTKLIELLKQEGAIGYVCGVVGSDGKILPYIGANSVGDLLTIKYVVDQEVNKVIEKHTASVATDSPAESQKEQ